MHIRIILLYSYDHSAHRDLHSFPTRRSSDLLIRQTQDELGGELGRDRNKADNLLEFLDLGEKKSELAALYPRMVAAYPKDYVYRSEEHTSELQSRENLVCRLLLEKKKQP